MMSIWWIKIPDMPVVRRGEKNTDAGLTGFATDLVIR